MATLSVASGRSTGMKWIAIAAMLGSALAISLGQSDLSVALMRAGNPWAAVDAAKAGCPVSKALAAVPSITAEATLEL